MQGFIITATEKCTLVVDYIYFDKVNGAEMKVKGTGSCFMHEKYVKAVTMQGFILTAPVFSVIPKAKMYAILQTKAKISENEPEDQ